MLTEGDLKDFLPTEWPNGGPSSVSDDRIVLHELTHAVMARTMDMQDLPLWFIEGTAEFSHGADARLYGDIFNTAGGSTADKVDTLVNTYLTNDGSVEQYSAGYAAVRYMHKAIIAAGGNGIRDIFDYLQNNTNSTLDQAIQDVKSTYASLTFSNQAELEGLFDSGDAGNTYIADLFDDGLLQNADTGAVGGSDADGGARDTTADGVVPDIAHDTTNPLAYFDETFPSGDTQDILLAPTQSFQFQVGADVDETIEMSGIAINAGNLGVSDVDVANDAALAILKFDAALDAVN
jgi:flagellin